MDPTQTEPLLNGTLIELIDLSIKIIILLVMVTVLRKNNILKIITATACITLAGCNAPFTLESALSIGPAGISFDIDASADDPLPPKGPTP